MSEEQVKEKEKEKEKESTQTADKKALKFDTADDLMKAMSEQFATSVTKIYINSIDQEVTFREITVQEQKSLTRMMSGNEHRKDIIYDAQCALINKACETEGFDIYKLSEFDRLKLMLALYQANMFQNDVKFTCEECGAENQYRLDFDNVIQKLDQFEIAPKSFHFENKKFKYDFVVEYPMVKRVSKFYESYCRVHNKKVPRREIQADENIQNMEYVNLFIKKVTFTNLASGQTTEIAFDDYPVDKIEQIISFFPQDVLYAKNGVLQFIANELLKPVNESFNKHECYNCHTIHEKENANQAESFF